MQQQMQQVMPISAMKSGGGGGRIGVLPVKMSTPREGVPFYFEQALVNPKCTDMHVSARCSSHSRIVEMLMQLVACGLVALAVLVAVGATA
mmetsp:Transcript_38164/g.96033  ORF Transcript_38164/g.96033 Transcript_38164/m.96033 type:complete len:91 (-) Transcript_38164:187-459(-)